MTICSSMEWLTCGELAIFDNQRGYGYVCTKCGALTSEQPLICKKDKTMERFFVVGGIFSDGTFTKLEDGQSLECYGPFATENDAERIRDGVSRRNIDICWHKLYVTKAI